MLMFQLSKIERSTERAVSTGATVTAEGQALVADYVNGGVKPATGAANEQFVGVSMVHQLSPTALPKQEELVANASYQVTIAAAPLASTIRVVRADTGVALVLGTPGSNATDYSISGTTITVHSSLLAKTIRVTYRYAPTVVQVKALAGDVPPGGNTSALLNSVGVVMAGDVVTTEFDTQVDWATVTSAVPIKLAANGLFTIGGSGGTVTGAYVTQLPSVDSPYLGIHFSV